jgi:glycosyltransferase involved in cell wall biosynthesis
MFLLSVVVPAYNERQNIESTVRSIPRAELEAAGFGVEVLVVDNGSTDGTGELARAMGARVIVQPVRGYGNAYKAGIENSTGDIIATGDADLTYPFGILPEALSIMRAKQLDFLSTNRLESVTPESMSSSHLMGNLVLSAMARAMFRVPFRDSQSGMWIFNRSVWQSLRVRSGGMAFSQEIKLEAHRRGFRCAELPITYAPRGGEAKLRTLRDGMKVGSHLLLHRLRRSSRPVPASSVPQVPMPTAAPTPASLPVATSAGMNPVLTVHAKSAVGRLAGKSPVARPAGKILGTAVARKRASSN